MPEAPWDTSRSTLSQHAYIKGLAALIAAHDCSDVDRTFASSAIDKLNSARRVLGIKVQEFDGTEGLAS